MSTTQRQRLGRRVVRRALGGLQAVALRCGESCDKGWSVVKSSERFAPGARQPAPPATRASSTVAAGPSLGAPASLEKASPAPGSRATKAPAAVQANKAVSRSPFVLA
mgnify:CR=1 FL=1